MSLEENIKKLASDYYSEIVKFRKHIHQNPELSFQEYNTANFIEEKLTEIGLDPIRIAKTGVYALIEGKNPSKKTIALRADIDALPILEENDLVFKSKVEGVMHACGHDVHTASLLGTAFILNNLKLEFEGSIKLIFQPGEEKLPGGASLLIDEGILENPKVESIIGQHVMPFIPIGKVGFRSGMYMASADEIYITVKGKGGHAAMPEQNIDPIFIASSIVVGLQQIVSRKMPAKIPTVLSFGKIEGGKTTNVIPNEIELAGTFRAMDEKWRSIAHTEIQRTAKGIAQSLGGDCEIEILKGYPYLKNEENLTTRMRKAAEQYLGKNNVEDLDLWMGAEDFAFYSHHTDACFYRLGTQKVTGEITPVHTSTFDIDEQALEVGAGLMAYLAFEELRS